MPKTETINPIIVPCEYPSPSELNAIIIVNPKRIIAIPKCKIFNFLTPPHVLKMN